MKTVVIGESAGVSREIIMSVYPRHKLIAEKFINRGDIIGMGPFEAVEIWQYLKHAKPPSNL